MDNLEIAKQKLKNGEYTYVICKNEEIYTSIERGVKPLVKLLEKRINLEGFSAADKVIGKATAFLYILLGIKEVYANVISESALTILNEYKISIKYDKIVEYIVNRKKDGICPFEEAVLKTQDPQIAYQLIKRKINELGIQI